MFAPIALTTTVSEDPSSNKVANLVSNFNSAISITGEFSMNPQIKSILNKISSQQATLADLTPEVISWLDKKNLAGKLKILY